MTSSPASPLRPKAQLLALAILLGGSLTTGHARARAGGIEASGCTGCHSGGPAGMLSLTAMPPTFNPGATVELTVNLKGSFTDGGVYINNGSVGTLQTIANEGLTKTMTGLVHNQPKAANGGTVQFRFNWVAPATPGAVHFAVYAIGGNGNGRSSGDTPMDGIFDFVYGCAAKTYYFDSDGDGVGRPEFPQTGCADMTPPNYAPIGGDCDDFRNNVYPGAPEICDLIDNNCDGQIDENAAPVELWPDADGDGYYDARTEKVGTPKLGCAGLKGWAATPGDCQPKNKDVNPGATEVCNNIDDDCDGDIDERVRPTCGEGWCRREAPGCDAALCMPGQPAQEKCNFLDDDCDGETDEGPGVCPQGQTCAAGSCVDSGTLAVDPGSPSAGNTGTGSAAGSNMTGSVAGASGGGSVSTTPHGGSATAKGAADSSGCALGGGSGHGALAILGLLVSTASRRRRRRRS